MVPLFANLAARWSILRDTGPTMRELERIGLTMDVLEQRAAEMDAALPEFVQARGRPLPEVIAQRGAAAQLRGAAES